MSKGSGGKQRKRSRWWLVLAVGIALVVAAFGADRLLKRRDHPGLDVFLKQLAVNYPASFAVEPEVLSMRVHDGDLEQLQRVVEESRARGVILPEGNSYVPAELESADGTFKAKVRIKGKLTDHVKGSKWSFRVIAKKDGGFLGMRRFSLQHPGTRNYLCDWFYHRLMAAEGVATLRYGFIRLRFNDEDLGIYAYEEHFGPELLERNGRAPGPIFRFDPGLFWEHRLNEMAGARFDEPFAAYQAATLDAFGSSDLETDKDARRRFEEAVALVDAFRRGTLSASQVFDADRIARHHAILDLIGGHHSMDWSDVKFYYDPILRRVEPISYESFSAHPIRTLAGSGRYTGRNEPAMELHTQWFNDEALFRAYIGHLERVSRKEWLDSAFAAMKPALDSASATVYREFPYKELDRTVYYRNQEIIRKLIDPPKPFHAYLDDNGPDTIAVTAVPIEALPMEVHALVLPDGSRLEPVGKRIVPVRKQSKVGEPVELRFALKEKVDRAGLKLDCSVLGAQVRRSVDVFPYALVDATPLAQRNAVDPRTLDWLTFDEAARTIVVKPGDWSVVSDVELPKGWTVRATAPLKLTIAPGVRLLSRSPLKWIGLDEAPISVLNDGELVLLETGGRSELERVVVNGGGRILLQQAPVRMERCAFSSTTGADHFSIVRSDAAIKECLFAGGSDGLTLIASGVQAHACEVRGANDDALVVRGGRVSWANGVLHAGKGAAIKLGVQGEMVLENTTLRSGADGVEVREGAALRMSGGRMEAVGAGVLVKDGEMRSGPSRVELDGVRIESGGAEVQAGKDNDVVREGKRIGAAPSAKEKAPAADDDDAAH